MSIGTYGTWQPEQMLPSTTTNATNKPDLTAVTLGAQFDDEWAKVRKLIGVAQASGSDGVGRPEEGPMLLAGTGAVIPRDEFDARFGHLDMNAYRQRMKPETFEVFVRFTGLVAGAPGLDIDSVTDSEA